MIYALSGVMLDELAGDEMLIAVTQDGCDAKTGPTSTPPWECPPWEVLPPLLRAVKARDPLSASTHQQNCGPEL